MATTLPFPLHRDPYDFVADVERGQVRGKRVQTLVTSYNPVFPGLHRCKEGISRFGDGLRVLVHHEPLNTKMAFSKLDARIPKMDIEENARIIMYLGSNGFVRGLESARKIRTHLPKCELHVIICPCVERDEPAKLAAAQNELQIRSVFITACGGSHDLGRVVELLEAAA